MRKVLLLFLSFILILSGCKRNNQQSAAPALNAASTYSSKPVFIMAGKIEANEKADITTKISAKVLAVLVDVGTRVKSGQPIIVLDTKDLQSQMEQAQAGVNTAQANLIKAQNGSRPEQISQAQAALDNASQNLEMTKSNYQRMKQLFKTEVISKQQYESAETQYKAAEAQYISAKNQLEIVSKGETQETLNILKAQTKQAQAAVNVVKTQLNNGTITSPISGVISAKNINTGELALAGSPLVSVVNADSMYINAYLPATLVQKVTAEQNVTIKVSEIPEKMFEGTIAVISPVVDPKSKNILVKVRIDDPDAILKPGMFAEIGIKGIE